MARIPIRVFFAELSGGQRIAFVTFMAEICLWPFILILFAFARVFPSVLAPILPNLWFLQRQYELLLTDGFNPSSVALSLRLFELIIWISASAALLRLILGLLFFNELFFRRVYARAKARPIKAFAGWVIVSSATWAAANIQGSNSAPLLKIFLWSSPYWYVCFSALMFAVGLLAFVEGLLFLVQFAVVRTLQQ